MRRAGLACGFAMLALVAGAAEGQQGPPPFDPVQTEVAAEQAAGSALMQAGEQYLNAGFSGPDSKSCRLLTSAVQHLSNAASILKKERSLAARDQKLLSVACKAS